MQIANIYPIANQECYKREDCVMILAHLVKKGYYKPENFNVAQWIIMDNGLFEGEQVSTNLQDLVDLAEESGIPVTEIIVPDVVNNLEETKKLFKKNLKVIKKYRDKYTFMFVAQATSVDELAKGILFANKYKKYYLSVGISKLSPIDRGCEEALMRYAASIHPIHFLGIKDSFKEILPAMNLIRSCDTSQLAFIAKNHRYVKSIDLVSYARLGEPIDLEKDNCDTEKLQMLINKQEAQFSSYGILR